MPAAEATNDAGLDDAPVVVTAVVAVDTLAGALPAVVANFWEADAAPTADDDALAAAGGGAEPDAGTEADEDLAPAVSVSWTQTSTANIFERNKYKAQR